MERIRRYLERAAVDVGVGVGVGVGVRPLGNVELEGVAARFSDTKSIGSLSQHLFESDEDERYYGTCNGYASQPGSKSNLLLCSECDQKTRTCTYRPQTPGSCAGRYVEERLDPAEEFAFLRADYKTTPVRTSPSPRSPREPQDTSSSSPRPRDHERHFFQESPSPRSLRQEKDIPSLDYLAREDTLEETEKRQKQQAPAPAAEEEEEEEEEEEDEEDEDEDEEEEEDSPVCELCHGNGLVLVHCEHCDFSTEGDLICFRCQSDEGSSNGNNGCPRCERSARMAAAGVVTSSDDENQQPPGKYPVDAIVKIKLNDRTIDVDSDDTNDSDPSIDRHRGQIDRLDTIVETKGDTASENDDDNGGAKLNGTTSPRYLNYMIVLFL